MIGAVIGLTLLGLGWAWRDVAIRRIADGAQARQVAHEADSVTALSKAVHEKLREHETAISELRGARNTQHERIGKLATDVETLKTARSLGGRA